MRPDSCDARFLFEKNKECGGGGWESFKFTVTLNARRVLLEKTHGIWKGFRNARIRERLVSCHMNLQSQGTQDACYLRQHKASGGLEHAFFIEKHNERGGWVIRGI